MASVIINNIIFTFTAAVMLGVLYVLIKVVHNIYFHPLSNFPGPKWAAASNLFYVFGWTGGRWAFVLEDLHKKYGPVVRFAPNDLDFATAESYQDIYGTATKGRKQFLKGDWYNQGPGGTRSLVMSNERDPVKHHDAKKLLAPAFSSSALRAQTVFVLKYVNMWVEQIKKRGNTGKGINMEEWYNWLTFDIIGDLAFGESFGAVENAQGHEWVPTIKRGIAEGQLTDVYRRVPLLRYFPWLVRGRRTATHRLANSKRSRDLVQRRLKSCTEREDFFSHIIKDKDLDLSLMYLTGQANMLVIAGSETVATFLAGTTFYLLHNPRALERLTQEVRSAYESSSDINGDTTQPLPYLNAVISEGLRIFPPVPAGLPRVSTGDTISGYSVPAGTSVTSSFWTTSHSSQYFTSPRSFCPERWLAHDHAFWEDRFADDVKDASRPFSIGPRACIGISLAELEMRIILARLAWEFDWEGVNGTEVLNWEESVKMLLLWQKPELWVRFKELRR
ncbi:cytochrome P450 monooxygenase-like protein [Rhexocercosporidium sp. MPI-PUGE-AT-0058]|nr:cytochrome P450 monooxygenase-like protein [Rhexocercosporidium sp. MPI-PUGE-AT-0058]